MESATYPWAASGRAQALGRVEGLTKWLVDPETERVLGCGMVGPGAGELIAEAVLALEYSASAEDLQRTIHAHPTLSEALHEAALHADKRAIDIPNRVIEVKVSEEELAARRAKATFQPKRDRRISQALRAYALFAASADQGAVRILPNS